MSAGTSLPSINKGFELAITPPEEAAGAAYDALAEELLKPLGVAYVELPMDLAERVLTNGEAVPAASAYVKNNPNCIYVKGPGITPRDDQVISTIMFLEKNTKLIFKDGSGIDNTAVQKLRAELRPLESEANMQNFAAAVKKLLKAIGSPNAAWRDALAANLSRGASDLLASHSLVTPPVFSTQTPLSVAALPATKDNRLTAILKGDTTISIIFANEKGEEKPVDSRISKLAGGTPLRLFSASKEAVQSWTDSVLASATAGAQIVHGTKQTVLKTYDSTLIGWMQEVVNKRGMQAQIAPFAQNKNEPTFNNLLVDDLFARLSTSELKNPMLILSPNQSYAAYVQGVWDKIKEHGGFKVPTNSEVMRASSTGDHYKATEFKASEAGTLKIKDASGAVLLEKKLAAGDVAMITALDKGRVQYTVKQGLDNARKTGKTNVLFGFDEKDEYYKVAVDELNAIKSHYGELSIQVMDAADATAYYLTKGVKNTALLLNNIYGDFATDIEICGKGTSYSVGRISDGRGVVELGSGGTAPDLIGLWKDIGLLQFNPMSFVEGISLALRYAGEQMPPGEQQIKTVALASAIESGMYATLDKGYVLPIIKGKFKKTSADYTSVSTHSFIQSVKVEALRALKKAVPEVTDAMILAGEAQLKNMIALDTAIYTADATYKDRWRSANHTRATAAEQAGKIDPFKPDYSIEAPAGTDVNADSLLALQEGKRAA